MTVLIDAHHHVWWDLAVLEQPWISGDALAPLRRSSGLHDLPRRVERTVIVQTVPDPAETCELPALGDPVAVVVGWLDLTCPDTADRIATLREGPGGSGSPACGTGCRTNPTRVGCCAATSGGGLRAAAGAGLAFDLLVTPPQLGAAIAVARALPDVQFVLDHLAKPAVAISALHPWAADVRELASMHNVTAKLSGLVTEADWEFWSVNDLHPCVEHAVEVFGPDRLIFRPDRPVCTLASSYDSVLDAARELTSALSVAEQDAIFGGTASRVYGLGVAAG